MLSERISLSKAYTPNFDLMRYIASFCVLVGHSFELYGRADPLLRATGIESLGGVGVSIFFAISGYLVTESAFRSSSTLAFIRKRLYRVMPALVVCVLLVTLVLAPLTSSLSLGEYFSSPVTFEYLFNSIFIFRAHLPGVVASNPIPGGLNGSLWTIPVEVKLYAIMGILTLIRQSLLQKLVVLTGVLGVWAAEP